MINEELTKLLQGASALKVDLSEQAAKNLLLYLDTVDITNRSFNLTRISRDQSLYLHLLDSLATLTIDLKKPISSVMDIGTGAGFPGVPIAAALPSARITLLDSTAKKVTFAHNAAERCGITNTVAVHGRAEAYAKTPGVGGSFDLVVSRAVAECKTLFSWMLPFVKRGGTAIALKGVNVDQELRGTEKILTKFGASIVSIEKLIIPHTSIERFLVVIARS